MDNARDYKARVEYAVNDATQTVYSFSFPYLRKKFVMAYVIHEDDTITNLQYGVDYTINNFELTLAVPLKENEHLVIYRQTTTKNIIQWNDGSILLSKDMNVSDIQQLHLQEEHDDFARANNMFVSSKNFELTWDALGHRITNVKDPKDSSDVVTKHYMESVQNGFVQQNTAIANTATEAAGRAKGSSELAKKWAMSPVSPDGVADTDSPTGYTQSAKIWAALSKEYAGLSKFKLPIGYYKSVAEMKASETAIVGRPCVTLGYYEPNDGGGGVYIIRQKKESDVDDGGSIIVLDNENVAELIIEGAVNVKQFGAKGDGATDNITAMQNCINYAFAHSIDTYIPSGTYCISNALYVYQWQHVNGAGKEQTFIKRKTDNTESKYSVSAIFILDKTENHERSYTEGQNISNMYMLSDTFIDYGIYSALACPYTNINNIVINNVKNGIVYNAGTWLAEISDVIIANPEIGIKIIPNGTSLHLKNTYVVAPSKIGYYTYALLYSSWENIACDRAENDAICYEFYHSNINISGLGAECEKAKNILSVHDYSHISIHTGTLFGLTTDDKREMIIVDGNCSLSLDSVNIGVNLKTPIVNNICLKGKYGAYFDIKNCTISEHIKNVYNISGDWSNSIQWDTGSTTSNRYVIGDSYKNRQIRGSFNLIGNVGGTPSKLLTGEDGSWSETAPHIGDLLVNQNPKNGIALFQAITDNSPYNMQGKITNIAENVLTFDSLELDNIANTRGIVITTDGTLNNVKIVAIDTQNKKITVADSSKFTVGEFPAYRTNGVYVRDNKYMGIQQVLALSTANRIINPIAGTLVFDTTLNKPIWYNGHNWVDANGNNV